MDFEELLTKYSPFVKKHILPLGLGLFGLIFLGYGLIVLFVGLGNSSGTNSQEEMNFDLQNAPNSAASNSASLESIIMVDVEGAVVNPGVYSLKQDARIKDSLIAAGGLSAKADREWVSKNLNLAMKLSDGAKIYIPAQGETKGVQGIASTTESAVGGLININIASETDLDSLSGVGPATAQKIIDNRPYSSIQDLLSKKAVSQKIFDKIKDQISVF